MLEDIRTELTRLAATEIKVALDGTFEPQTGLLLRIERGMAYWHVLPEALLTLLKELPDGVGSDHVHRAIEKRGVGVWHGPSPQDARDTPL
jgi:hypothetical protein